MATQSTLCPTIMMICVAASGFYLVSAIHADSTQAAAA
jgi:hypothetical protein